ncbi:maleylacetoacetate isomerase [Vibrio mimicus]|uniref:Maleylacetoacetate isomerase n=1 Tax=Vibrio mimicus TaxID=674 RepID=A0A2J9V378_VIBMI|nr:maleylacetoacetate isomerase [Vibrio mimicus]ERM56813.1 maleylacetoacetate isomerase [Vibrio mimicus CAIM 1883]ERM56874.1 maleylacetoacetate isomerase [Vibrio mimicus CAIM 1882]EEW10889.1 Probable maleylacetoacetate isomerase [Vibrio mimicus VM573]EGU18387.1 maleylacetoacetate isomerase [Vibrio mimicus SX-4]EMB51354.1 maleylacetoacetate isomerase [Vibrio mimicus CAIM 602]
MSLILYGYWRSSAAYRVRIALNIKQLTYESRAVHLSKDGGEQHHATFHHLNPSELIPVLIDGEFHLNQSLAIIEYLDEIYPEPRLIPARGAERYQVKALALDIAADIHPINNLRILQYLSAELAVSEDQKNTWYRHWIDTGFRGLEEKLSQTAGEFSVGNRLSLVDVCLVPQVYNAERFNLDMSCYPTLQRVAETLRALPAFVKAAPENQPDAH